METTNYWHALDRTGMGKLNELEVDPLRIGISHGIGDVGEGLKANIFRGLRTVELGFFGTGKGFRSQPTGATPESFGSQEREDIRELARINEVELSTHAAPDLGPLSGFTGDRFSKEQKEGSLQEVRRALDFAADTARGGAVVVHIGSRNGEFPRALFEVDKQFEAHPLEKERAPLLFVDKESGQIQNIPRTMKIFEPMYEDPETKKVYKSYEVYEDPETKKVYKSQVDKDTELPYKRDTTQGLIEYEALTFDQFEKRIKEEAQKKGTKVNSVNIGEKLLDQHIERQIGVAEGEALRFDTIAQQEKRQLEVLEKQRKFYNDVLREKGDITYARKFLYDKLVDARILPQQEPGETSREPGETSSLTHDEEEFQKYKDKPDEYLNRLIASKDKSYRGYLEIASSRAREVAQTKDMRSNLLPVQDYALPEIKDSLARAAISAYDMEQQRGLEKPLFISPENWSPESYGSHPQEYKKVIQESQRYFAQLLSSKHMIDPKTGDVVKDAEGNPKDNPYFRGLKFDEANKIAKDHIKGTFDVGHLNFWRKYFKGNDAEFRQWVDKEVDDLAKSGVIGNVHLSDNFGYHDEHLAPGQGNAPIERFVQKLEKEGYKGHYIGEPGGQKEGFYHTAWTGALNTLRSPMYRTENIYGRWSDIEHSYFGLVPQSPGFLVGDIVPSKDWTLWSETPLE